MTHRDMHLGWRSPVLTSILLACLLSASSVAQTGPVNASVLTSIHDIQYTTHPYGVSPRTGDIVTIRGIVTAIYPIGFVVAEAEGPWNAIFVYSRNYGPQIGHKVQLTGTVKEYYGLTEIVDVTDYHLLSVKHSDHIRPVVVGAGEAGQEAYESVLVTCANVTVSGFSWFWNYYWEEWHVQDMTGSVRCSYKNDYTYYPSIGDLLDAVTGIVDYEYGNFKLQPRSTRDIVSPLIPHYAIKGTVVTMDKQRRVIPNGYVEIHGNDIVKVSQNKPPCDVVCEVDGYIFPGLIDAHNHPFWNVLGTIPFAVPPYFTHRDQWRATSLYGDFSNQMGDIYDYALFWPGFQDYNVVKFGELRALCAGTTTWQGTNCNYNGGDEQYAAQGVGINNAERFPARNNHIVFPLSNASLSSWPTWLGEYWERFVVHLSEGTNQEALDEFYTLKNSGIMDDRFAIIHGVPLDAPEYAAMAAAGVHMIWSPQSNVALYGATANIPAALAAEVNVALGADWTESGSFNLLDEMRFARSWSQAHWNGLLTAQQLTEFVTVNAADALGILGRTGSIEEGKQADLMIVPALSTNPYEDLLATHEDHVMLTVVSGRPMYGDQALMQSFPFLTGKENVTICGIPKTVAWAIPTHHVLLGGASVAQMTTELIAAYNASSPKVAPFIHYDRCTTIPKPYRGSDPAAAKPLSLAQNYPNPFNPSTTISFSVPVDGAVQLVIYDALGREVAVLVDESRSAGQYSVDFDASSFASGSYICRLTAGGETLTRWMTLAR